MKQLDPLTQKIRDRIAKKGLFYLIQPRIRKPAVVIMLIILIGLFAAGWFLYQDYLTIADPHPDDLFFVIFLAIFGGALVLGLILSFVVVALRKSRLRKWLESLEDRPGGSEGVIKEIEAELTQGEAYMTLRPRDYITKNWFVKNGSFEFSRIVSITDIAIVINGFVNVATGFGRTTTRRSATFVYLTNGDKFETKFGTKAWSHGVSLLRNTNPHILINGDEITLPSGKTLDVSRARRRHIQYFIDEFLRRKDAVN